MENSFESDCESLSDYEKGGYHNAYIGEKFNNGKYILIQKLGYGTFSIVYMVKNIVTEELFAMKIIKSKYRIEKIENEINIWKNISKILENKEIKDEIKDFNKTFNLEVKNPLISLFDYFVHTGHHGSHICWIFDLLGPNLLDIIEYYREIKSFVPIDICKSMSIQIIKALDIIKKHYNLIHTDIKPENICLKLNNNQKKSLYNIILENKKPKSMKLLNVFNKKKRKKIKESYNKILNEKYDIAIEDTNYNLIWKKLKILLNNKSEFCLIDFGNSCEYEDDLYIKIQTFEYQSPENIIESKISYAADIWSLACTIFEFITNEYLFEPKTDDDLDHLNLIVNTIDDHEPKFFISGNKSKSYFNKEGMFYKNMKNYQKLSIQDILIDEFKFIEQEAKIIAEFLGWMLKINPKSRYTSEQLINLKIWFN